MLLLPQSTQRVREASAGPQHELRPPMPTAYRCRQERCRHEPHCRGALAFLLSPLPFHLKHMPSVTIIGAGVFGLSVAHSLPLLYDVTIVARDMPGDPDSLDWASPWYGPLSSHDYTSSPDICCYNVGLVPVLGLVQRRMRSKETS